MKHLPKTPHQAHSIGASVARMKLFAADYLQPERTHQPLTQQQAIDTIEQIRQQAIQQINECAQHWQQLCRDN